MADAKKIVNVTYLVAMWAETALVSYMTWDLVKRRRRGLSLLASLEAKKYELEELVFEGKLGREEAEEQYAEFVKFLNVARFI